MINMIVLDLNLLQSFSLIELLVVMAIVGALAAIAIPAYSAYSIKSKIAALEPVRAELIAKAEAYYSSKGVWPASGTCDGYGGLQCSGYNPATISPILVTYTGQIGGVFQSNNAGTCPSLDIGFMIDGTKLAPAADPIFNVTFGFTNNGNTNMLDYRTRIWSSGGVFYTRCGAGGNVGNNDIKWLGPDCQNTGVFQYTPTCA